MLSPVVRTILAGHAILVGLGYAVGPAQWVSSPSFAVVRSLGIPIPMWGMLFVLAGLLVAVGRYTLGHGLAAVAFTFWGCCIAATVVTGELAGWGSIPHTLALAAPMHLVGLWRRSTARVAARGG